MLEARSVQRLDQIEIALRLAVEHHGGKVLSISRVSADAVSFTLCLSELQAPLLAADSRFAALLPVRVAACTRGEVVTLESLGAREFCRLLHRPELEPEAAALEEVVREILAEATSRPLARGGEHASTEDQVNMRAALPQRINCHGTKIEELAGVGVHDAQGG